MSPVPLAVVAWPGGGWHAPLVYELQGDMPWGWEVYSRDGTGLPCEGPFVPFAFDDAPLLAVANAAGVDVDEVHARYNNKSSGGKTYHELVIDSLIDSLSINPHFLMDNYLKARRASPTAHLVISDLSTASEYRGMVADGVRTVRVMFAVGDQVDTSVHVMDKVCTDFLLVKPGKFRSACTRLPQYRAYMRGPSPITFGGKL